MDGSSYIAAIAQTIVSLVAVCAAAWWVLRWGARRGLGGSGRGTMTVLDRVALDARHTVTVVRIGKRVLVLGTSEQSVTLLTELREDELAPPESAKPDAEKTP